MKEDYIALCEDAQQDMLNNMSYLNNMSNIEVLETLDDDQIDKYLGHLDRIEDVSRHIRKRLNNVIRDREKDEYTYHRVVNEHRPMQCGLTWQDIRMLSGHKAIVMYGYDEIPVRRKCRWCRIADREIEGTDKERFELEQRIQLGRRKMGWD